MAVSIENHQAYVVIVIPGKAAPVTLNKHGLNWVNSLAIESLKLTRDISEEEAAQIRSLMPGPCLVHNPLLQKKSPDEAGEKDTKHEGTAMELENEAEET